MVGNFLVIDTIKRHFDKTEKFAEQTYHQLCLVDQGEAPLRVMPRYTLEAEFGEIEKFGGGQLNGKTVKLEIREMSGKGNPTIRGRIVGTSLNGK